MQVWRGVAAVWLSVGMALSAQAQTEANVQAERLLSAVNMEKVLNDTLSQMLDVQMQSDPRLEPYRAVFERFYRKHLSFASLKPEIVRMYVATFTADELRQLVDFYATPVGQKAISTMPELMNQGAQLGMSRVQAHQDELRQELEQALREQRR